MKNKDEPRARVGPRLRACAPVLLPLLILIVTGVRGLDFGLHWDERPWQIGPVKQMVERVSPLPGYYDYPSFDYWLNLLVLLPDAFSPRMTGESLREHLLQVLNSHEFLLRLRMVYVLITSLSVVWVYLLYLKRGGTWPAALFAASLLACSWEVAYHLRWVATDGMLMQFAVLTVLLATCALNDGRDLWLFSAATVAGLGFATKYPGGLLILPVTLTAFFTGGDLRKLMTRIIKVISIFVIVFVVVTPATILRPSKLAEGVLFEMKHYATGHGGHTVGRGFDHAWYMLTYFSTVLWSPYVAIAVLMFIITVIGFVRIMVQDWRKGAVLLIFPISYLLYFSTQGTMVIRNLLAVVPFFAIAAAYGGQLIAEIISRRQLPISHLLLRAWAGLLVIALCFNAYWLIASAETIVHRHSDRFVHEAARYIRINSDRRFLLSPRVKRDIAVLEPSLNNVTLDPAQADAFVLYAREGMMRWHDWPANRPNLTQACFGPREINFNMYPGWWGDDRILVISHHRGDEIDLHIAGISNDTAPAAETTQPRPPAEAPSASLMSANSLPGSWASNGMATYTLPPIDPRILMSRTEAATLMGQPLRGPASGGWELDGRACTFLGPQDLVLSIAIISTNAFALERYDPTSKAISGVGLSAYVAGGSPLGGLRLFARTLNSAVIVHISGPLNDKRARLKIATDLATSALYNLDIIGESRK